MNNTETLFETYVNQVESIRDNNGSKADIKADYDAWVDDQEDPWDVWVEVN